MILLYQVNSVITALLSAFSHTNIRLWKKIIKQKTLFLQVELFFNSEYGLQKEPNINIHFTQIKEQTTAREIAEDM